MKLTPFLLSPLMGVLLALPNLSFADSAKEILEKHKAIALKNEEEQAAELKAYLEKNAQAPDRDEAEDALIATSTQLGKVKDVLPILEKRYKRVPKNAASDLQELIGVAEPLFEAYKLADKEKAKAMIGELRDKLKEHPKFKLVNDRLLGNWEGGLNMPVKGDVMEISFTSLKGDKVDLADMKGKVVLIDFWATWCGPCMAELPNVQNAYKEFHAKGFEIIGISLDQDKADLEKTLAEKHMTWQQNFDGKGWQNEIATKFGIKSIPATFLINKDGKVEATDLRGPALSKKLGELLQ